jgi:hypothetical protein
MNSLHTVILIFPRRLFVKIYDVNATANHTCQAVATKFVDGLFPPSRKSETTFGNSTRTQYVHTGIKLTDDFESRGKQQIWALSRWKGNSFILRNLKISVNQIIQWASWVLLVANVMVHPMVMMVVQRCVVDDHTTQLCCLKTQNAIAVLYGHAVT